MTNAINILLLITAVLTCLAVGVVLAYAACQALFLAIKPRAAAPVRRELPARQTA